MGIENADLLNGQENLSGNWSFDIHGEHCLFENLTTGQTLEVSLGDKESVGNLDPYFFYLFLQTSNDSKHLIKYFNDPFHDTLDFFEELERNGMLTRIGKIQFRKVI